MKKWIFLGVLLVGAGGYFYVQYRIDQARQFAEDDGTVELTDAGIREGLLSSDPKQRMDALAQIEKLPEAERMIALIAALDAPSAPTRLTAVTALGKDFAERPEAVLALTEAAKEDLDADVREAAFNALATSGDIAILELAAGVLLDTDASLRVKVRAAALLDRLTGKSMSEDLSSAFTATEEAADDLAMTWDDWLGENRDSLKWDSAAGRFVGAE